MFLCNDFVWPIGQLEQEKGGHFLSSFSFAHCCTEVHFVSFLSGGFITAIVVNPPERKLAKRTSVYCCTAVSNRATESQLVQNVSEGAFLFLLLRRLKARNQSQCPQEGTFGHI